MDEEEALERACAAIELAASEAESSLSEAESTATAFSAETLRELNEAFQDAEELPPQLWDIIAQKAIPLGRLSQCLSASMDYSSSSFSSLNSAPAISAANVFLSILMAPGCPVYSFFTPIAFINLLRSLKNCLRRNSFSGSSSEAPDSGQQRPRKGGTRGRKKGLSSVRIEDESEDFDVADNSPKQSQAQGSVTVEDALNLVLKIEKVLRVLQLKGNLETLKALVELLAQLPHLVSDFVNDFGSLAKGPKPKRLSHRNTFSSSSLSSSSLLSACSICYRIMDVLVESSHGDPSSTAVTELRALVPSIMMSQTGGSLQQKEQIRQAAMQFIVGMVRKSSEAIRRALVTFPRTLSINVPDKSDARALAVESILTILKVLNSTEHCDFATFVVKLSRGRSQFRLMAVDLAFALLGGLTDPLGLNRVPEESNPNAQPFEDLGNDGSRAEEEIEDQNRDGNGEVSTSPVWWGIKCLEVLLDRCSDKVPAVRARAMAHVANSLELLSTNTEQRQYLQTLLGLRVSQERHQRSPGAIKPISVGCHKDIWGLLRNRCVDEKASVRKAAIILMTKSSALLGQPPDDTMLQAMGSACSDPMVSIKKAALHALSEAVKDFPIEKVISEWLQSVPPLIMDNEASIQEDCLNYFEELVFNRISSVASVNALRRRTKPSECSSTTPEQEIKELFPDGVLPLLKGLAEGTVSNCVKRICSVMGKKKRVKPALATALQNIISTSESIYLKYSVVGNRWAAPKGTWFLLSEISTFVPKVVSWEFLHHHWKLFDSPDHNKEDPPATPYHTPVGQKSRRRKSQDLEYMSVGWGADRVHLLQTISCVAVELDSDSAAGLASDLLKRLEGFNMHPTEVGAHVKALVVLCKRQAANLEEGDQIVGVWARKLLVKAEKIIDEYISQFSTEAHNDSYLSPQTNNKSKSRTRKVNPSSSHDCSLSIHVVTAVFTVGALVLVCPTAKLGRLDTLLKAMVTSKSTSAQGQKHKRILLLSKQIDPTLYAQSWIALGKICLANEKLAKGCIPLFLKELEVTECPAVRNNIMVTMTDFCVRYTALVDGYIPTLTKSLRDPCEIVRRQTFTLLARLLQRDYVKWRGILFHRFLLALVDESEKIRELADFLFGTILKTKAPLLAYNSFVEAIFILNDCQAHAGHIEALQASESERRLFSLRGNNERASSQRMHIYVALLKQMQPEHILATSAKICAEILAVSADGLLSLDDCNSVCVLQDALRILACKEMRIQSNRGGIGSSENADLDEEGGAAAAFAAAKGRVVTHIAKKNLVQNSIPIFIELKRLLESRNSPLIGCLMDCLRTILKEFKNELDEILVADKQLQKEILYDIQKHEASKAKSKVAEAFQAMRDTPGRDSVLRNPNHGSRAESDHAGRSAIPASGMSSRAMDKENNAAQTVQHQPKMSALRRKDFLSPGGEGSAASKIRWADQGTSVNRNASKNGQIPEKTLNVPSSQSAQLLSPSFRPSRAPMLSPSSIPPKKRENIASAVADMAATQTADTVLKEVALKRSTPLKAMSIPKLKPSVPSTMKARHGSGDSKRDANLLKPVGPAALE